MRAGISAPFSGLNQLEFECERVAANELLNTIGEVSVNVPLLLLAGQLGVLLSLVAMVARPVRTLAKKAAARR
jgi:hypothetical protein